MKLMTAQEIAELKAAFDKEVDSGVDFWAYTCFEEIKKQIKAQNTGVKNVMEGKIQIHPCRFYVSRDLDAKIKESGKEFHYGGQYASEGIDLIRSDVWDGTERRAVYKPFEFSGFDSMYKILNPDFGGRQYEMFFIPTMEQRIEKVKKGLIFKREVEVRTSLLTFKGNQLKLLEKLNQKCKEEGVELTGLEILYFELIDGTCWVKDRVLLEDIFGCVKAPKPFYNCILLRWKYRT